MQIPTNNLVRSLGSQLTCQHDLREFIESEDVTGFEKKGLSYVNSSTL